MASIPEYIIKDARKWARDNGGGQLSEDAFIAGFKAARKKEQVARVLTAEEIQLFEDCWKTYGRKGSKKESLDQWKTLTMNEMLRVMPHVMVYVASRAPKFKKDFQRYLCHRIFNDIVIDDTGVTIYDPKVSDVEEYHPTTDGIFQYWDEKNKRLIFNGDIEHLDDGYTADTRPDGAKASWGMYNWVWSRELKSWIKHEC